MTTSFGPELDLTVARIIEAPRSAVWTAWTDPASFEQWWVPAPEVCRVRDMDLHPGGSSRPRSAKTAPRSARTSPAVLLAVDALERIVFTDALVADWRPAEASFMTAVITMKDHPDGTAYTATAMHRNIAHRDRHKQPRASMTAGAPSPGSSPNSSSCGHRHATSFTT